MRFLLIDKIKEIIPGESALGVKCWSMDNEIFQDHFPGLPTTPGVLLTESMAQLAGVLIKKSYYKEYGEDNKVYPVLSIIQKVKFRSFVSPGDQCILKVKLISIDRGRANVKAETYVDAELVCEGTLSFMIGMEMDMKTNPRIEEIEAFHESISPKTGEV
ncbi:MAG: 3-hydroxyacyl-ACP dehydratase FabZ family protein [Salibacteraceae bacterium]